MRFSPLASRFPWNHARLKISLPVVMQLVLSLERTHEQLGKRRRRQQKNETLVKFVTVFLFFLFFLFLLFCFPSEVATACSSQNKRRLVIVFPQSFLWKKKPRIFWDLRNSVQARKYVSTTSYSYSKRVYFECSAAVEMGVMVRIHSLESCEFCTFLYGDCKAKELRQDSPRE